MRTLRALSWVLAVLVVALVAAAYFVPPRVDPKRWRAVVTELAQERLGRQVEIGGKTSLVLLPEPMLAAQDVTVQGLHPGASMHVPELRLRVGLVPLIAGRVDARELVLRGAELTLPWPLDPAGLLARAPAWLASLSARIEGGRVEVGNLALEDVNAVFTAAPGLGGYRASGTADYAGKTWRFDARASEPGRDGSAAVEFEVAGTEGAEGFAVNVKGQIGPDGAFGGRLSAEGPSLALILPGPAVPFHAQGRVTVASGLAAADDLLAELDGAPTRGAVALRVTPAPRLDLALAASRLSLDAWVPGLMEAIRGDGPAARMPVGIDLSAEAATLRGGTLRTVRAALDLGSGGLVLREARALLPGEAMLRLSGKGTPPGGDGAPPRFEGDMSLDAPALRRTLAWAEAAGLPQAAVLPPDVLRTASIIGHLTVQPGQIAVGQMRGQVDGANLTGSITLRNGERPAIGAGLALETLELDPWVPEGLPGLAALPTIPGWFRDVDLDVRLEAKQARFRGLSLAPFAVDASASAGQLSIRRLDVTASGLHATASASIDPKGRLSEGRLDMQSPRAEPLAALLPDRFRFFADRDARFWQAAAAVQVLGSGAPDSLDLRITADLADLRLEAQPTLNLAQNTWTASASLRHPGAPRLLEALGLAEGARWMGEGSLGLAAQLSGTGDRVSADRFELTAGALSARGHLMLEGISAPHLSGAIRAETLPLPLPAARSTKPIPVAAFHGWSGAVKLEAGRVLNGDAPLLEDAGADVSLAGGVLRVNGLSGRLSGGAASGSAVLDTSATPPIMTAKAATNGATITNPLFGLPLDLTGGTADASVSVSASGFSPAAQLATLSGSLALTARNGRLAGVALGKVGTDVADDAVRAALTGGETTFDTAALEADVERGIVTVKRAEMTAPSGTGRLDGTVDLPSGGADLHLVLRPAVPDAPELGLRLSGPLDGARRTPELAALARWRATRGGSDAPTP